MEALRVISHCRSYGLQDGENVLTVTVPSHEEVVPAQRPEAIVLSPVTQTYGLRDNGQCTARTGPLGLLPELKQKQSMVEAGAGDHDP